jgi:hypothetical protein
LIVLLSLLSENFEAALADAIFDLGKPVVIVLEGGRPFAIPEYYEKCAAALDAVSISASLVSGTSHDIQ